MHRGSEMYVEVNGKRSKFGLSYIQMYMENHVLIELYSPEETTHSTTHAQPHK